MTRTGDLRFLVRVLLEERAMDESAIEERICDCANDKALFDLFRALVNTRPPQPASKEFFKVQDRVLQGHIAEAGITDAAQLPRVPLDSRLSLWRGDITTLAVDAIVNAANSELLGCWVPGHYCIDNAIHTFAGVQLRLECARIMGLQGHGEPTGEAKVTSAYNLPSRYVIHTVGPIVQGSLTARDEMLLAQCYASCLNAADGVGCESIAFCCISTGVFGFPKAEAASIAVSTVREWLDAHASNMHVVFNVFGEEDERIYQKLLG